MGYKTYCTISGALFSLVALGHLLRIMGNLPVTVGTMSIPMYVSWGGLIVPALLAIWAFRTAGR
jgi:hypothetical protein